MISKDSWKVAIGAVCMHCISTCIIATWHEATGWDIQYSVLDRWWVDHRADTQTRAITCARISTCGSYGVSINLLQKLHRQTQRENANSCRIRPCCSLPVGSHLVSWFFSLKQKRQLRLIGTGRRNTDTCYQQICLSKPFKIGGMVLGNHLFCPLQYPLKDPV